jgi:RHS repeat-associated protein
MAISAQQLTGAPSGTSGDTWTAGTYTSNQFSQIEVSATPLYANETIGPAVRAQNNGQDAYLGLYNWNLGNPELQLFKRTNSAWQQLGAAYPSGPLAAGTQIQLDAVGTHITLLENGVARVSVTDTSLAGGAPAVMANGPATADNWTGGNLTGESQGSLLWYHHDQLGSTRLLTTYTATIAGTATYNPYGNTTATTGTTTHLGYTGAYTDPQTGLLYLINRYYDPTTAQFLNRDPLAAITQQPYAYAGNDPVNNTHTLGLYCNKLPAGAIGPPECFPGPPGAGQVYSAQQAYTPAPPCSPVVSLGPFGPNFPTTKDYAIWLYTGGASTPQYQAQQALNEYIGDYRPVGSGPDTGPIIDILSAGASCILGGTAGAEAGPAGIIIGCGIAAAYDYAGAPPGAENWFGAP